ncbi:FeoB-associated Cys-rich membrane protein [Bremerella sp. JC770]|uniref:FeoB-associated Cys-rich membrane protein n=1 Tax=Bremerella sp. JC770 TaxID=3232137 RepID=UPI00345AABE0
MWQNIIVLVIVASAAGYIGWTIIRGIQGAAGSCGGGCGSGCGAKSPPDNLVQLGSAPQDNAQATSPDEPSAVSSTRS